MSALLLWKRSENGTLESGGSVILALRAPHQLPPALTVSVGLCSKKAPFIHYFPPVLVGSHSSTHPSVCPSFKQKDHFLSPTLGNKAKLVPSSWAG